MMTEDYCCQVMQVHSAECPDHPETCPDQIVRHYPSGWGIPIHDGGSSWVEIKYCPWCGTDITGIAR